MKFLQMIRLFPIILIALFPQLILIILERVQLNLPKLFLRLFHLEAARIKSQADAKAMMLIILKRVSDKLSINRSLKKFFLSKDLRLMFPFSLMV
jgi:hypothetical protein